MNNLMDQMIDIQLSKEPLDVASCYDIVQDNSAGGNVLFVGTVRDQTEGKRVVKLDFEAYQPMAKKEMQKIAEAIIEKWSATHVSIHHRIGSLEIGEIAVIISVSSAHRSVAFEACQYAIDTLKETVPIWKKEFFEDGAIWVAAHP